MSEKKLYLIDGTNQVFRAFYAIKSQLTNREGLPTNAVYGFVRMLKKLIAERKPSHIAAAFDCAAPTFRHQQYAEYKANRPEPPDELSIQFPYARKVCEALGVPVLEKEGFEADDIIGTLAGKAKDQEFKVVIVASDKDLLQLVDDTISMLNPQKETEEIDRTAVKRVFGVFPEQVVDVIGLWGDAVDNIPGVPGIGEKKAKEIVSLYGSIDSAMERADRFMSFFEMRDEVLNGIDAFESAAPEKKGIEAERCIAKLLIMAGRGEELKDVEKDREFLKKLASFAASASKLRKSREDLLEDPEELKRVFKTLKKELKEIGKGSSFKIWESLHRNRDAALISRQLARIEREAPVEFDPDSMQYKGPRKAQLEALFDELEFSSLLEEIRPEESKPEEIQYRILSGAGDLRDLEEKLRKARMAFLGATPLQDNSGQRKGIVIAFHHPQTNENSLFILRTEERKREDGSAYALLKGIFENDSIRKVGYDLKDLIRLLEGEQITLKGVFFDVKIAIYLLDPSAVEIDLEEAVKKVLKEDYGAPQTEKGKKIHSPEESMLYCSKRAFYSSRLFNLLQRRLVEENLEELYENIEVPLIGVLAAMESAGVKIDVEFLKAMSRDMEAELETVMEEIYAMVGERFNINSPKQLGDILFTKIGLKHGKKTPKSGIFTTSMEILQELAVQHPLPAKILEYRSIAKIKSTYVDALPALLNAETGRIHTSFNQTGTATGRLSSSDPNLQNIPVRTEAGREIRKAFIPEEGNLFLCSDYSQVELRILAHLSDDHEMIESFIKGEDIHRTTASMILGIPYENITESHRRFAKTINFGIIYGMSAFRLSRELGISRGEAVRFIESYFSRFKGVKEYIDETTEFVRKEGYVTTLFGRVRYFKEIKSANKMIVQQAIRQAINTTIQGTAADIIKQAMISIHGELKKYGSHMVLQVHDELLFEVPRDMIENMKETVRAKMEGVYQLKAPLIVNLAAGQSWADAK